MLPYPGCVVHCGSCRCAPSEYGFVIVIFLQDSSIDYLLYSKYLLVSFKCIGHPILKSTLKELYIMVQEMKTVGLWISEKTETKLLALKEKIEHATNMKLTHDTFIDTLLNYELIIMDALDKEDWP